MKLHDMGQKVRSYDGPTSSTTKKVVEYPEVNVSSSQLDGLEDVTVGKKCRLVFDGEVISVRKPGNYDVSRGEGKNEILGTFRLLRGAISSMGGKKAYNDMEDAKIAAEEENE